MSNSSYISYIHVYNEKKKDVVVIIYWNSNENY